VAAEALVRWNHPGRGRLLPSEFVPLAEETGLIVALGQHVLEESCRKARAWQEWDPDRAPSIHVNLSAVELADPYLTHTVGAALSDASLDPSRLVLEITESLIKDADAHAPALHELRAMGVRLALDDFGTGYSSLSYLHQFPIDILKIDRSFIHRIGASDDAVEIVNTILALASSLDMEVVAEGVETEQQLELLRKMHCAYAQGYHLSRPVEAPQFESLVGTRRSWAA
jgi:EAL domain-containing protein (putative c-di-GMP-specific phosphodiesterase class I)